MFTVLCGISSLQHLVLLQTCILEILLPESNPVATLVSSKSILLEIVCVRSKKLSILLNQEQESADQTELSETEQRAVHGFTHFSKIACKI